MLQGQPLKWLEAMDLTLGRYCWSRQFSPVIVDGHQAGPIGGSLL